jgi:hypothetical protein
VLFELLELASAPKAFPLAAVCLCSFSALAEKLKGPLQAWVLLDGETNSMSVSTADIALAKKTSAGAKKYFWFRTQDKTYGITDITLLADLAKLWKKIRAGPSSMPNI